MTAFWLLSGLAAALAALAILTFARKGLAPAPAATSEGARQIAELEALRDRGLMDEAAFVAARAEAGRRLLASEEPEGARAVEPRWTRAVLLGGLLATAALALGLYVVTGSPGRADEPYVRRVDEWATQLDTLDAPRLAAVAERVAAERPDDREAQAFLGRARFEAGDAIGAATAIRRALALDPNDPINWARLGEALTVAQQGVVGADAEAAFGEALRRDPANQGARYFLGRAAAVRGDAVRAREMWTPLLAALPPSDPRRAALQAEVDALEAAR